MNTNCLDGMRCPSCGSEGPFQITVYALATVSDDGVDGVDDVEWDSASFCYCTSCDQDGRVSDFTVDELEDEPDADTALDWAREEPAVRAMEEEDR